jgi:dipeptidyl aminopeptidase/acylaminoacyl peptidase
MLMPTISLCALLLLAGLAPDPAENPRVLAEPADAAPVLLGTGWLSSAANDYNLSTDDARQLLVFGRSSTGDFHDARIWVAAREGDGWSAPVIAPLSDPRWRDSDPWLTPDGRWLYFVSNRPAPGRDASREDLDLWRAPVSEGRIGALEHLAAASSAGEELGPELHDGALVFNSTRAGGPAALALYRAPLADGTPAAAEPMPAPFNDGLAQGDLTFSPGGRLALFWSIRGERRDPDLFAVRREADGWSAAVRLPAPFNAAGMDFTPAFSADGNTLRWASQRSRDGGGPAPDGSADLYGAPAAALESLFGE